MGLSWKKRILLSALVMLGLPLTLELLARGYFAFNVGPSVLLYGTQFHRKKIQPASPTSKQSQTASAEAKAFISTMTPEEWRESRTVVTHPNKLDGYSKYFPNHRERVSK